jgi:uncharacterized protein YneR
MVKRYIIVLFLVCNAFTGNGQVSVESILNRYYNAVGDKQKWDSIYSIVEYFRTEHYKNSWQEKQSSLKAELNDGIRFFKKDGSIMKDRFITIPLFSADSFSTCYNGAKYWSHKANESPDDLSFFANEYGRRLNCGPPCAIMKGTQPRIVESVLSSDVIELFISEKPYWYYFDKQNGLLTKYHQRDSQTMYVLTDYREVNGLTFPFEESVNKGEDRLSFKKIKTVLINKNLNDHIFDFPNLNLHILPTQPFE